MIGRRLLLMVVSLLLLVGGTGATWSGGDSQQLVLVPVILDGVRYEPQEFNRVAQELRSQGIVLRFVVTRDAVEQGYVYAFSTEEGFRQFLDRLKSSSASTSGPSQSVPSPLQACPPPDSRFSLHYEHVNCGGDILAVDVGLAVPDLRPYGWNDRISSVQAAFAVSQDVLYEHINYGGASLSVPGGWTYPDLRIYGWNDRTSSLMTMP